jgi:hypothetical protein
MKLRRLENEPDASGNTTENPLDTWLMKVRLERLEYDLGQSATKAERWKQAAEEDAHQRMCRPPLKPRPMRCGMS